MGSSNVLLVHGDSVGYNPVLGGHIPVSDGYILVPGRCIRSLAVLFRLLTVIILKA